MLPIEERGLGLISLVQGTNLISTKEPACCSRAKIPHAATRARCIQKKIFLIEWRSALATDLELFFTIVLLFYLFYISFFY